MGRWRNCFPKDVMVERRPTGDRVRAGECYGRRSPVGKCSAHVWPVDPVAVTPLVYVPERRLLRAGGAVEEHCGWLPEVYVPGQSQ